MKKVRVSTPNAGRLSAQGGMQPAPRPFRLRVGAGGVASGRRCCAAARIPPGRSRPADGQARPCDAGQRRAPSPSRVARGRSAGHAMPGGARRASRATPPAPSPVLPCRGAERTSGLTRHCSGRGGPRGFQAAGCRRRSGVVSPPPLSAGVRRHPSSSTRSRRGGRSILLWRLLTLLSGERGQIL